MSRIEKKSHITHNHSVRPQWAQYGKKIKEIRITFNDFLNLLNLNFNKKEIKNLAKIYRNNKFSYVNPSLEQIDRYFYFFYNLVFNFKLTRAGTASKYKIWERGWSENYYKYLKYKKEKFLIPKYVRKNTFLRLNGNYIIPISRDFEKNFFSMISYAVFLKFFKNINSIYEFGCGTGHNLIRLAKIFPKKKLYGLDYSLFSQKILNLINLNYKNINSHYFNLLKPDYNFSLDKNAGVFTVGALEQIGSNYFNFFKYLKKNKPSLVINFEPLDKLFSNDNLSDYLSKQYLLKRNYLKNYLTFLEKMENKNVIKIIAKRRTFGCQTNEGYSFVIYKFL